jgi:hypothetical protein
VFLLALRSQPRVIIAFGARSANICLHTNSITQHPAKSITITLVSLNLNCKTYFSRWQSIRYKPLTISCISTICSHRFNSGTKSVAPENATALAPTRPQYSAEFSRMPSRKGRPCDCQIFADEQNFCSYLEVYSKCGDLL